MFMLGLYHIMVKWFLLSYPKLLRELSSFIYCGMVKLHEVATISVTTPALTGPAGELPK